MFDLISGTRHQTSRGTVLSILVSTTAHVLVLGLVVVIPLLYMTEQLPDIPTMMAFVAAPPLPPPPPPPPPTPAAVAQAARPVPTSGQSAAPVEAPSRIEPEAGIDRGFEGGVPGGVEGGVPGGVVGGIVGGIPADVPPPPPPIAPRAPVRVGGQLQPPALVHRVAPDYPDLAVRARVAGTVILEALVDEEGQVKDVRVLRSIPLLDQAAIDAVRQWRYSPLLLNGNRERFILTVTVKFTIPETGD